MKIAYIINHDISKNDGVVKKILSQITEWQRQGHDVEIFCSTPRLGDSILLAKQYLFTSYIKSRILPNTQILSDIYAYNPSVIYFRYDTWSRTLSRLFDKYPTITELNTLDLQEFWLLFKEQKSFKSFFRYVAYKIFRGIVLKRVAGIIAVTKEIAQHPSNAKYNRPTIYIPNGIDLNNYEITKSSNVLHKRIELFFIGTPNQSWHGVDIIEEIAKKIPEFDFHIIGIDGKSTQNLFWYGYLSKEQYIAILKQCHICIGTLALHKKGMREACPLKVREYLAYGYPTIVAYQDTAFLDTTLPEWFHQIDIDTLNINEIKTFCINNKDFVVEHENVCSYVDSSNIESKRLKFISSLLDD